MAGPQEGAQSCLFTLWHSSERASASESLLLVSSDFNELTLEISCTFRTISRSNQWCLHSGLSSFSFTPSCCVMPAWTLSTLVDNNRPDIRGKEKLRLDEQRIGVMERATTDSIHSQLQHLCLLNQSFAAVPVSRAAGLRAQWPPSLSSCAHPRLSTRKSVGLLLSPRVNLIRSA